MTTTDQGPYPAQYPVQFAVACPDRPLGRLTSFFRIFVIIPIAIGAFFTEIATWFAILFTGRYPRGIFSFAGRVFRWPNRVSACASILVTDQYPPFRLDP